MTTLTLFAERLAQPFLLSWGLRRAGLCFLLGVIAAFSMPPFGLFPLLMLVFPALVWVLDGTRVAAQGDTRKKALGFFAVGWWFSFGFFLVGLSWIGEAFLVEADVYAWMMPFAVVILPAGLALFSAFSLSLASFVWGAGPNRVVALAVALTLSDFVRAHAFTGFPWNSWGYAVAQNDSLIQLAAYLGLFGLSFLVVLVASAPAALLNGKKEGRSLPLLTVCLLLVIGATSLGFWRLNTTELELDSVDIVIIQPNIPQSEKWKPENRNRLLPAYLSQTRDALADREAGANPTLVFWPESAFPFLLTQEPGALAAIADIIPQNTYLVTGGIRSGYQGEGNPVFYNSVYLIDNEGIISDVYDKVRLVPFGEYLPLRTVLQSIGVDRLVPAPSDFTPGFRYRSMDIPGIGLFQPLVCYEAIFPQTRLEIAERPQFIANITNDGWFGESFGPYQHLIQARMRAVEQGIPVIRAANTGISAVISPLGDILSQVALNSTGSIKDRLPKLLRPTLYAKWGDWISVLFILGCVCLLLVFGALLPARRD
ncbi:apolipoprotein N-acyltransferase [Pseudovibrio exalbescens]|uniref:Apolipoprotein N-acyltransferase n=1 Tax=Pseudovibrio exalbescens TaxID=197461 RepID=A0A1U7JIJ1_9HYPH|nr:apolipoprotein N-acyltransferase [Pseudovibrio exalbescens]OKL44471.1 acyltransferase [Pseudovibrio exalbescens]